MLLRCSAVAERVKFGWLFWSLVGAQAAQDGAQDEDGGCGGEEGGQQDGGGDSGGGGVWAVSRGVGGSVVGRHWLTVAVIYVLACGAWHLAELSWARGQTFCSRGGTVPVGCRGDDPVVGVLVLGRPPLEWDEGSEVGMCAVCVRVWAGR